jgi:hypothetical protein
MAQIGEPQRIIIAEPVFEPVPQREVQPHLYDARVGYIGGDSKNPSYRSVCSGRTGRMFYPFKFCRGIAETGWWKG